MRKKIITIVGARPQFIKTPLISKELAKFATEILVHTGQHYDSNMSAIFLKELKIKKPKYNLGVGSDNHGVQTAKMLEGIEKILLKEKPNLVIIYGDTNSTIAGSLAAAKLHIPVAHVEAGLRSYNREMPEEINRIVTDNVSDLLFAPTKNAVDILKGEGITKGVHNVGDVMTDLQIELTTNNKQLITKTPDTLHLSPKTFLLVTIHRQENTDKKENLVDIVEALTQIKETIIWPLHPRTKKMLEQYKLMKKLSSSPYIRLIDPIGYLEMMSLETHSKMILTDSGGVQKEAYIARVPCITLRNETEWVETVISGWNHLVGTDTKKILKLVNSYPKPKNHPNFLGDGKAYLKIAKIIKDYLK